MRHLVPCLVVAAAAWMAPATASACSPPTDAGPCPERSAFPFPGGGVVDVPLNTEVSVEWRASIHAGTSLPVPSTTFRLTTETGEVIPLEPSPTSNRWRPTAELLPSTVYVLEDQIDLAPSDAGCAPSSAFVEVARFTTGTQRDDVAPAMPTEGTVDACCRYTVCDHGACCGSWSAARRGVRWTVDADTSLVAYRVGGELLFGGPLASVGWSTPGMFGFRFVEPTLVAGNVEARAIDGAGNVSEWTVPLAVADCDRTVTRPDGGSPTFSPSWEASCTGPVDAGVPPMDASSMDASVATAPAGSCSAVRGASPASGLALVLGALFVRGARRRRGAGHAR